MRSAETRTLVEGKQRKSHVLRACFRILRTDKTELV